MKLGFLGKATVLYAIGNICLRAASFLLIPIYAHFLSVEDYGLLMTLLLSIQFMLVVMNCGTEHSVVRFAKHYEENGQLNCLMGTTFVVSLISSLIVFCVCLTLLIPFFRLVLHHQDVYLLIVFTLSSALFQSWCDLLAGYYRSQHQPIKYTVVGICTALMLTLLSFVFLYILEMGVKGALLARFITLGWIFSIIAWQIYSKTGFRISFKLVPKLLHFGVPLTISSFGLFAITGVSIYFLSFLTGLESVAVFSLGQKLAAVLLMVLVLPFQMSFQPFVFSQLDSPDIKKQMSRLLSYLAWSVMAGSYCVLFGARLLLPLIAPPEYADAYLVTLLMMPGMAFLGIFYYGETLLKTIQKSYIIGLIVIVSAVFSIIANFILVNYFSWYGALLASNATLFILGGSLFMIGLKEYPLPIEWPRLGIGAVLFVGVLVMNLLLLKSNLYLYCTAQLIVATVILFVAFRSSLLDEREKQFTRQTLSRLVVLLKRTPREESGEISRPEFSDENREPVKTY
ncbi:MAG: oligosaccharide flippase family protein [Phycisphaerae bacterium]|nr:oligosaccharide flippase family protein [Phycisphaerae bacterium]